MFASTRMSLSGHFPMRPVSKRSKEKADDEGRVDLTCWPNMDWVDGERVSDPPNGTVPLPRFGTGGFGNAGVPLCRLLLSALMFGLASLWDRNENLVRILPGLLPIYPTLLEQAGGGGQ